MAEDGQELQLTCQPEYEAYSNASCAATCLLKLKAPPLADSDRAPVSLTAVLDVSQSMAGEKLDLVKRTCLFLLKQLCEGDSIGVIVFDHQVRTRLP